MPINKERYKTDPEYRRRILERNAKWAREKRKPDTRDRSERRASPAPSAAPQAQKKLGRILGLKCGWSLKNNSMGPRL